MILFGDLLSRDGCVLREQTGCHQHRKRVFRRNPISGGCGAARKPRADQLILQIILKPPAPCNPTKKAPEKGPRTAAGQPVKSKDQVSPEIRCSSKLVSPLSLPSLGRVKSETQDCRDGGRRLGSSECSFRPKPFHVGGSRQKMAKGIKRLL